MINLLMDHLSQTIELNHLDKRLIEERMKTISIDISQSRSVTFYDVYRNGHWLSPHPTDSIEARWGLKKCQMILAQIHTAGDCIAFIKRTYEKKDPKYAAFSIRQQQVIIQRLTEELTNSQCYLAASVK